MQDLKQKLSNIRESQLIQDKHLKQCFFRLANIQQHFHFIKHPYKPQICLFTKIRIELLCFIFEYLDFQELLTFRLVNKTSSELFNLIINVKIKNVQIQREKIQQESHSVESQSYLQLLKSQYEEARNRLSSFQPDQFRALLYFVEKTYWPEYLRIILFCISCLFNVFSDYHGAGIDVLRYPNKVKELINFDISFISDKQLKHLQEIDEVERIKCEIQSKLCFALFDFLSIMVKLRQTEYYQQLNHLFQLNQTNETLQKFAQNILSE